MSLIGEQVLLRAYLRGADRAPLVPTSQLLVKAARNAGLAGATVLQGIMGFGGRGVVERAGQRFSLVEHLPLIVEIVDAAPSIAAFIDQTVPQILTAGMVTLERAAVMLYRHRKQDPAPDPMRLMAMLPNPLSTIPKISTRHA